MHYNFYMNVLINVKTIVLKRYARLVAAEYIAIN